MGSRVRGVLRAIRAEPADHRQQAAGHAPGDGRGAAAAGHRLGRGKPLFELAERQVTKARATLHVAIVAQTRLAVALAIESGVTRQRPVRPRRHPPAASVAGASRTRAAAARPASGRRRSCAGPALDWICRQLITHLRDLDDRHALCRGPDRPGPSVEQSAGHVHLHGCYSHDRHFVASWASIEHLFDDAIERTFDCQWVATGLAITPTGSATFVTTRLSLVPVLLGIDEWQPPWIALERCSNT